MNNCTNHFVRAALRADGLQTRPIEQLHTRTALESRPHSFLFAIFGIVTQNHATGEYRSYTVRSAREIDAKGGDYE
jgi:hypothetical protein